MRPKVLLAVATLGLVCVAGLFVLRNREGQSGTAVASVPDDKPTNKTQSATHDLAAATVEKSNQVAVAASVSPNVNSNGTVIKPGAVGEVSPRPRTAKGQLLEERHREEVENRASELMELAMNDDTNSLQTIVSELNNSDPDIRQAALDATIQFGSSNAIPALESAALWNDNPEEKQQIADAIEFLKLPQLGDPAFPITGTSKGPARKPPPPRTRVGPAK